MRFCLSKHVWWRSLKMICGRHYWADKGPKACRCQHAQYVQFILRHLFSSSFCVWSCMRHCWTIKDDVRDSIFAGLLSILCQTFNLLRIARPGAWGLYELHTSAMGEVPGDSVTQWSVSWSHGPRLYPNNEQLLESFELLGLPAFWKIPSFSKFNDIYNIIDIIEQGWDYLPNKEFVLQSGLRCWYL